MIPAVVSVWHKSSMYSTEGLSLVHYTTDVTTHSCIELCLEQVFGGVSIQKVRFLHRFVKANWVRSDSQKHWRKKVRRFLSVALLLFM